MTQSDLALKIGVNPSQVSRIISGERGRNVETYQAIAHALNVSPERVFRAAGLLPDRPDDEIKFEDWEYLLAQLPPEDQEELRKIAELKIERRRAGGGRQEKAGEEHAIGSASG